MTYTPEELDRARGEEAARIHGLKGILVAGSDLGAVYRHDVSATAARLARENWQPPPKVDSDVLAARKACADAWAQRADEEDMPAYRGYAQQYGSGERDSGAMFDATLTAIRTTREAERAKVRGVLGWAKDEFSSPIDTRTAKYAIARIREKLEGLG